MCYLCNSSRRGRAVSSSRIQRQSVSHGSHATAAAAGLPSTNKKVEVRNLERLWCSVAVFKLFAKETNKNFLTE